MQFPYSNERSLKLSLTVILINLKIFCQTLCLVQTFINYLKFILDIEKLKNFPVAVYKIITNIKIAPFVEKGIKYSRKKSKR